MKMYAKSQRYKEFNKTAKKEFDFLKMERSLKILAQLDQVFADNANFPDDLTHGHNFMCFGQVRQSPLKHATHNNNHAFYLKVIVHEK